VCSLCTQCGRCCIESGVLCGVDEWKVIMNYLRAHHMHVPKVRLLKDNSLVVTVEFKYLNRKYWSRSAPETWHIDHGSRSSARKVCPLLNLEEGIFKCSVQPFKPAACLAYPFWVVTEELSSQGRIGRALTFRVGDIGKTHLGEDCYLGRTLLESPVLYSEYTDFLNWKLRTREGAYTLGLLNQFARHRNEFGSADAASAK